MIKIDSCAAFLQHLDTYLDGELEAEACLEMEKHAASCEECRKEMQWRTSVLEMCAGLDDDITVPPECHAAWKEAIRSAEPIKRRILPSRWVAGIAACMVLWLGITGVLRGSDMLTVPESEKQTGGPVTEWMEEEDYDADYVVDTSSYNGAHTMTIASRYSLSSDGQMDDTTTGSFHTAEQKVIRSAYRALETTAYDADLATLNDLVAEYDAYFENRTESGRALASDGNGRSLSATIRVPTRSLDNFLTSLVAVGTMVQSSESAQDVSDRYYDSESRLVSQRAQLQRLQEMYASAETVEDLLSIESRITDVQYEIEQLEAQLAGWDSQVSYSTVTISLDEVAETDRFVTMETTLPDRIAKSFQASVNWLVGFFQDAVVVLAMIAPAVAVLIPVGILIYVMYRLVRKAVVRRK